MHAARHTADLPTTLPAFAAMFPDRVLGLATTATRWPEYKTLYATKAAPAEGLRRWVHPNPRVKVTEEAVEAIFADLLDAAHGELRAWILNHENAVRWAIRRSCERG